MLREYTELKQSSWLSVDFRITSSLTLFRVKNNVKPVI